MLPQEAGIRHQGPSSTAWVMPLLTAPIGWGVLKPEVQQHQAQEKLLSYRLGKLGCYWTPKKGGLSSAFVMDS